MITCEVRSFFHIYNFASVKSGSRLVFDQHIPHGSGSLVKNRSLALLAFSFLVLSRGFFSKEISGFCIGTRHCGDWRGWRFVSFQLLLYLLFFNCTIWAWLSVGTLGFIKLDTILYRSYFDITTRLWGLDWKLQCENTSNLTTQNARIGCCLSRQTSVCRSSLVARIDHSLIAQFCSILFPLGDILTDFNNEWHYEHWHLIAEHSLLLWSSSQREVQMLKQRRDQTKLSHDDKFIYV